MDYSNQTDQVAILLCTFHGETFLTEQLNSFEHQTHHNWQLYVSDDSSDTLTHNILQQFQRKHSADKVHLRTGPRQGFAINFLSLVCDETLQADYYAFSDQDDIWEADKLSKAVTWLRTVSDDVPAVYCSRCQFIDEHGENLALSFYFPKQPCFPNALVQNIAGGNTMVFNHAARKLLILAGIVNVSAHDWWVYAVVTACGGKIKYDRQATTRYRLHQENTIGFQTGIIYRIKSFHILMKGHIKQNTEKHINALSKLTSCMTNNNREVFYKFVTARNSRLLKRLIGFYRSGIHRQTLMGNIALTVAVLLNRI